MKPLTRDESRDLDRLAQERLGLPGDLLMENAGGHVARVALELARETGCGRVLVLCGPGNNGGDGFVAARHLLEVLPVDVMLLGDPKAVGGDARKNLLRFEKLGGAARVIETREDVDEALAAAPPLLVIDALFGTGLTRPLEGLSRAVVEAVNASDAVVVAVDLPSGLDCDTGDVLGAAIRADRTVTFVAPKIGFGLARGPEHCGRVIVASIGFPPAAAADSGR